MKELTIEITNRCRLNCLHCSTNAGKEGGVFFTLDEISGYLKQFLDFESVRISGGEPFEHPDIVGIASLIKSQGRNVCIMSCGVISDGLISEQVCRKIKPFVDEIVFSVQGDWDTHDYIVSGDKNFHRHPRYWDGVMDSADNARLAGILISYQTVAMQANYHALPEIARMVGVSSYAGRLDGDKERTTKWHVLRFVKQGRGAEHPELVLSDEQAGNLPDLLTDLEGRINRGEMQFIPYACVSFSCTNTFYLGKSRACCGCGSQKAVVTCYREVIPCSSLKYSTLDGKFACKGRI